MAIRFETAPADIRAAVALLPNDKDRKLPPELEWRGRILADLKAIANDRPSASPLADLPPDKLEGFLDEYAAAVTRQEAADRLLKSGAQATLESAYKRRLEDYLPTLLGKLAPVAQDAAQRLTDAAGNLPPGDDAFDATAVLAHKAGDAYATATEAITVLTTVAAVLVPKVDPELRLPHRPGHAAAAIINPPANTTPTKMGRYRRQPIDPDQAARNRATAALMDGWRASPARTLLAVARGEHPGSTISLATTQDEADHRATLLAQAAQVHTVEDAPAPDHGRRDALRAGILAAGGYPIN